MYKEIQRLAEEALALQNKDHMDAALNEIRGIAWAEALKTSFEDARIAKFGSEPCPECMKPRARCTPVEDAPSLSKESLEDLCRDVLASGEDITLRPTEATFKVDVSAESTSEGGAE